MRKIKFRAKSLHTGDWHYGDLVQPSDNAVFIQERGTAGFLSDPETVGQFTGLHDKDGREIYEGDVCIIKETAVQGTIDYIDGGFTFKSFGGLRWGWDYCLRNGLTVLHSLYDNKIGND